MSNKWWPGPNMVSGSSWRLAWFAAMLLVLGCLCLALAGVVHGVKVVAGAMAPDPVHICDAPKFWGWSGYECIEYIEYYDYQEDQLALVGNVRVNEADRHTIRGFSQPYQYGDTPQYTSAAELLPIMGCPEWADAVELAAIGYGAEIRDGMA
jgi:hypothetical protein